jgi:dephospho-CoA kinase
MTKLKKKRILTITGLPGSGKTSAIEAIRDLGVIVSMGDVVRNEAKKRNLKLNGENLGRVAKELRVIGGQDIIAKKCVELIKDLEGDIIFVDGVRSLSEVNIFRKYWKFPIIAIVVNEEIRFQRLFERARSDDPKSLDELRERDIRELEFGLVQVLEEANYKIVNNSTLEDLKKKTRDLVLKIIKEY